jgi:alcohol dehydrogenase class IV
MSEPFGRTISAREQGAKIGRLAAQLSFWPGAGQPALERYAQAARLLTGDPVASVHDGLGWIRQTLTLLAVPGLGAFGIRPQHAGEIAAKALMSSSMHGNPVALSHGDLEAVLRRAL